MLHDFGRSGLKGVGINTGEPKNWGALNTALLGWKAWLTPRYMPLPNKCYHVKFSSSASKGVCINRREPQKSGSVGHSSLAVGVWLTP